MLKIDQDFIKIVFNKTNQLSWHTYGPSGQDITF